MDRDELIKRYRQGADAVDAALEGVTDDRLDRRPADGGWSARQVVHHLADSEMTSAIRLRRLLTEDDPVIAGYDENEYARRLHYDRRPIEPSLAAMRAARDTSADLLDHLAEDDWDRAGTHTESGAYSVGRWLEIYADHAHDHAEQIGRALDSP
ncbi:MAG: hypothetical protein QOF60_1457 [Actinomycetota bacterium]|jgi:hypothetical protein|nr:hypothetical protein [Actinomycetota bacterium]